MRTCCASAIGEDHQSGCHNVALEAAKDRVNAKAHVIPRVVQVDGGRFHLARVLPVEGPERLECVAGCDLTFVSFYETFPAGIDLERQPPAALCPSLSALHNTH